MTLTDAHLVNEALSEQDLQVPAHESKRARWLLEHEIAEDIKHNTEANWHEPSLAWSQRFEKVVENGC